MEHVPKNNIAQDVRPSNCFAIAYVVLIQNVWTTLVYMNWIASHRRFGEGVPVGNCRMNHLLFADELVLRACIFSTGSSAHIWSIFCCVRPSRNENQHKMIEVLRLSRQPRQCIQLVRENTLHQEETFKYLGVVFTSDWSRNKGLIHGLVKLTKVSAGPNPTSKLGGRFQ